MGHITTTARLEAIAEQLTAHTAALARIEEQNREQAHRVDDLESTVYGNGTVGLKVQLDRLYTIGRASIALITLAGVLVGILVACNTLGITQHANRDVQQIGSIRATVTAIEAELPTPTARPTTTPTPAPPEFVTPTAIAGNPTSEGIIEVTPLGGQPLRLAQSFALAWYTPNGRMKVRAGPGMGYPLVRYLGQGAQVRVYAEVFVSGDAWLCLSEHECAAATAYRMGGLVYGDLEVVIP